MSPAKNVYSIAPGVSFLNRLAQFILDGSLNPASTVSTDPLLLSRTTVYLPTRRAVRSLRGEFSRLLGPKATFLPALRTLGDGDEEDINPFLPLNTIDAPTRAISAVSRQLVLAKLVKRWVEMIGIQTRELFAEDDIIIPSSSAESIWLAREIASLIDQMETEEISWENLESIVPQKDEYANWWQLTLDFLKIAMKSWPEYLLQVNAHDPSTQRRLLLDIRTKQLQQKQPDGPVIAAGSTGSIPATARFLKAISQMDQGAVILPGLDTTMSDDAWLEILGENSSANPSASHVKLGSFSSGCEDHPQYGLAKLLCTLAISRDEVKVLGQPIIDLAFRSQLTSIALLPSAITGQWRNLVSRFRNDDINLAANDITIIEAPGERQEALAIALVLRKQVENPDCNAALVTPDRNLARRVTAELKRFNLKIDDSGGVALQNTSCVVFIRLMIAVTTQPPDPVTLASFVKNSFLGSNVDDDIKMPTGRLFELCLLRDVIEIPAPGRFEEALTRYYDALQDKSHIAHLVENMDDDDWLNLFEFCKYLDQSLAPLVKSSALTGPVKLIGLCDCLLTSLKNLNQAENKISKLFSGAAGLELSKLLEELSQSSYDNFSCRSDELLSVFDAIIAGRIVRTGDKTHPRISIYGPLEARLQPIDCVIMGGLNEGTWPQLHDSGPFLNRPMKTAMELATPERRTGLSAHDFEQLMASPQVFLTRSGRVDNAPTVPSRWMQRLTAILGKNLTATIKNRGNYFLKISDRIDQPTSVPIRIERPCPTPAIIHRPKGLSITEIETWIRDPYAIYAKRILKLLPLGSLGTVSEPAMRGTILHDVAADFVQNKIDPFDKKAQAVFLSFINRHLLNNKVPAHLKAIWMPRFIEIARDYIAFEQQQSKNIDTSYCEIDGKITLNQNGFRLRGRADRIDLLKDGSVQIIDYKTGLRPTIAMARTLAPQLALEGAMVLAGGFENIGSKIPSQLEYVRLRPHGGFKQQPINNNANSAQELSIKKREELEQLIKRYNNPEQGYLSRFAVEMAENISGDYDHLARIREWSWGSEEAEAGGDHD
ncbi:MAG: double-strand break repair protein AddB [Hyphomicrobiales bacterium]|nr:double-strand break repair protein AddB [Hyphomicrobiales bacterium]